MEIIHTQNFFTTTESHVKMHITNISLPLITRIIYISIILYYIMIVNYNIVFFVS